MCTPRQPGVPVYLCREGRQSRIVEKMHDDLQDLAAKEAAEKAKQIKNREEK